MSTALSMTRKDEKREAILSIARAHFFRTGYAGTSMSAIAAELGGSKTTLWSHFPSKEQLFFAVADQLIAHYVDVVSVALRPQDKIEETLRRFGRLLLTALLSDPVVALGRLVAGEADRFPELGSTFHKRGLGYGWSIVRDFLQEAMADGKLRPSDSLYAAKHFLALCQAGCYQQRMFGDVRHVHDGEIAADVDAAVDIFLAAYGNRA